MAVVCLPQYARSNDEENNFFRINSVQVLLTSLICKFGFNLPTIQGTARRVRNQISKSSDLLQVPLHLNLIRDLIVEKF